MQTFEEALKMVGDATTKQALIDVADTCHMAQKWFAEAGLTPTAADLLYWTDLMISRENQLRERI